MEKEANQQLDSLEYLSYKALQDQAMKGRKGLWLDFKPLKEDEKIVIKTPVFEGIINEVVSGSIFVVKNQITKESE